MKKQRKTLLFHADVFAMIKSSYAFCGQSSVSVSMCLRLSNPCANGRAFCGCPGIAALLRFWTMLAHYHGNIWNAAEPARSIGVSEPTVRLYLDVLTGLFMVRQLQPWHENLKKRQVKAPKIYVRDSGLLHQLLGIATDRDLYMHPKYGASWEGYAIEETLKAVQPDEAYFWATHQGAELDLMLIMNGRRLGVEVKRLDAPTFTPSMRIALEDLKLDQLVVLYPGKKQYALNDKVTVMPLSVIGEEGVDVIFPRRRGKGGKQ